MVMLRMFCFGMVVLFAGMQAWGVDGYWSADQGGLWSDTNNWANGVKPTAGSTAHFTNALMTNVWIEVDEAVSVERIRMYNTGVYQWYFRGAGPLTLAGTTPRIEIGSGSCVAHFYLPVQAPGGVRMLSSSQVKFYRQNAIASQLILGDLAVNVETSDYTGPAAYINALSSEPLELIFDMTQTINLTFTTKNGVNLSQDFTRTWLKQQIGGINAVPSGSGTVDINLGQLAGSGMLRMAGMGSVRVEGADRYEGSLRFSSTPLTVGAHPNKRLMPASMPDMHLDASQTNTMVIVAQDGTNYVTRWNSVYGDNYAYCQLSGQKYPVLQERALNGLPIVDFGLMTASSTSNAYMRFATRINAKSAFVVLCSLNFVFTDTTAAHFHAVGSSNGGNNWNIGLVEVARKDEPLWTFKVGDFYFSKNGTRVTNLPSTLLSGKDNYDVLAVRTGPTTATIGSLALDRAYRYGGAKIAELIVYTRTLSEAEFKQTEQYLLQKWKNIPATIVPVDLEAREIYAENSTTPLVVEPQATVAAERYVGARAGNGVSGGGTLQLARTAHAAVHPLQVVNGTLALSADGMALPAAPATSPISNTFFHVDASVAETLTRDATNRVSVWADCTGNGRAAVAAPGAPLPLYVTNALNGLPYIDFATTGSGQCMLWNHTNTTIQTAFLVFADPGNNGENFLLGDVKNAGNSAHFHRGSFGLMAYPGYEASGIKGGLVYVNGLFVDPERTTLNCEPVVITYALSSNNLARASAFATDRWELGKTSRTGGQKICEVVIYDRMLMWEERTAVQNWLMKKWLPKPAAGYQASASDEIIGEVRAVATNGQTAAVAVISTNAVRVGALSGPGTLVKKGAGTLLVEQLDTLSGKLQLDEGVVQIENRELPDPFVLPGGLEFHVDASKADSIQVSGDGVTIEKVSDASGGPRYAVPPVDGVAPTVLPNALNGLPVIDFGARNSKQCLLWDTAVNTIRTVFWVIGSQNYGGVMLGSKKADGNVFYRPAIDTYFPWKDNFNPRVANGVTRIDSTLVDAASARLNGGYQVVSLVTAPDNVTIYSSGSGSASAFAVDRYEPGVLNLTGGQRLGEVLIFNRVLTDQERRDVEAYLQRKWFNRLPGGYVGSEAKVGQLALTGGTLAFASNAAPVIACDEVVVSNTWVKRDATTVGLYTYADAARTLVVSNGVVALRGQDLPAELPAAGKLFHLDASAADSLALVQQNGTNYVAGWTSLLGNAWATNTVSTYYPVLLTNELNGLPVVDFGPFYRAEDKSKSRFLDFSTSFAAVKSAFLVIGTQEGGNFLICTTDPAIAPLHRGGQTGALASDPIVGSARAEVPDSLKNGISPVYVDGAVVSPTVQGMSGGYQTFGVQMTGSDVLVADTLARDRTWRFGGQRIAEYLLYDRMLSEGERQQVELYLQSKWFGKTRYGEYVADVGIDTVQVGGPGVLDMGGHTHTIKHVSGDGVISNGTLRVTESFTPAPSLRVDSLAWGDGIRVTLDGTQTLDVAGSLSIEGAGVLTFQPGLTQKGHFALVSAQSVSGAAHVSGWTIHGVDQNIFSARLEVVDTTLYAVVSGKATLLLVR